ncbi:D-alanyl-D-alanine carboxypeptidase family protein [Murimonas intestini]|uniref:serine-type D-Ala-D-Ala carboxypeptidase n=1 Tax=Murimonas intestini TaxID=1337051 RepID=A0AB73T539_9FIRM|nr:D-alanyl-D-alanine carboxypeptidase family protein [Murimonas intestini]MCR1840622.1 D-alanyl-D-alanine carboxypeptidase [Murimonas intestini]MCR1865325.1 D-alanyl-D-alanine carboxypeptidase [Murimonas intestini]MCR1882964.1 D-alanyl-D-alanine carboxypeptidase [Murimonas intestini]
MKKILSVCLACILLLQISIPVSAAEDGPEIESPAAILMEASTGTVLYEKAADEKRSPASVTKIMTVLLVFEAIESGKLKLEDEVVTSAHAKSMGGSQVFLEEGEKQTVDTMLKCIIISSGNDAAVAMAEKIGGTEEEFVRRMNQRAKELGMNNTHFVDCCGLTESTDHYTTARDIALMSRELITKFPQVFDYSTIWMENITHVTNKGSSEFGLTNTNKLLRSYDGCKGLKTGSTSIAKFCLSAVAERDGIEMISVIMAAPDSKTRFNNAATLLSYGFGKCALYTDANEEKLPNVQISKGVKEDAACRFAGEFRYLDTNGADLSAITKEIRMNEEINAPVEKGAAAGKAVYMLDGKEIGTVDIIFEEAVDKAGYLDYLKKAWDKFQCFST